MPRLRRSLPTYRKHRASGQAIVTLSGQDFYLGLHGTKTSHLEYDRHVAEWLAHGRRPLDSTGDRLEISNIELILAYKRFAAASPWSEGVDSKNESSSSSGLFDTFLSKWL